MPRCSTATARRTCSCPGTTETLFVGECKFWRGPKSCCDAIDQLLGNLVRQDTKAALILFIRDVEPSDVIDKADTCFRDHAVLKSTRASNDPNMRRHYVMLSEHDDTPSLKWRCSQWSYLSRRPSAVPLRV